VLVEAYTKYESLNDDLNSMTEKVDEMLQEVDQKV